MEQLKALQEQVEHLTKLIAGMGKKACSSGGRQRHFKG